MKLTLSTLLVAAAISACATDAFASQEILHKWRETYPDSTSDRIGTLGCQLCHVNRHGSSPWNAYGWRIREILKDSNLDIKEALEEAFESASSEDSDKDLRSRPSIDEINYGFQPGWTEGNNNTHFPANGPKVTGQLPPDLTDSTDTALDWPTTTLNNPIPGNIAIGSIALETQEVAVNFNAPLKAVKAPGINGSLFVVEQIGRIFRVDLATGNKTLFHDVSFDLIDLSQGGGERGLLGLAFHPNFAQNGLFYTYQSEPADSNPVDFPLLSGVNHQSVVAAYRASNPSCNSPISVLGKLLVIDQPQGNHNGGDLAFGPDGFLYISLGDGGSGDDEGRGHGRLGNGRDASNPLGAILRIDPLGNNSSNGKYGIPVDNPFVNKSGIDEIYAYGFRNPFRMSFDKETGELYAADVGQRQVEEVNLVVNGGNFGWNNKEGTFFFYSPNGGASGIISDVAPPALPTGLVDPIAQYDHDGSRRISITGGYVYRGDRIAGLQGRYVFADYLKQLFYLDNGNSVSNFSTGSLTDGFITGFGQDADNELYILTNDTTTTLDVTGKLLKLVSLGAESPAPSSAGESTQCPIPEPGEDVCTPIKAQNGNVAVLCL